MKQIKRPGYGMLLAMMIPMSAALADIPPPTSSPAASPTPKEETSTGCDTCSLAPNADVSVVRMGGIFLSVAGVGAYLLRRRGTGG